MIMGCVVQAGIGQAPARQAALKAGLPPEVSALTVNMVCGSGLRAVALAGQSVQLGDADFVIPGQIVADILVVGGPERTSDGSTELTIEALTIAE